MLRELHIENFALVRRLDITFGAGFNVLSGETGAGKSIIIDALGVLLGGRAGAELVRNGANVAVVQGVFLCGKDSAAADALREFGLEMDEEDEAEVIISREFTTSGKNRYRINGRPLTREMLTEVAQHLVDIYGQHEHQSLCKPAKQLLMLDAFGGDQLLQLREEVQETYHRWRELSEELRKLGLDEAMRAQRQDMLRFQVGEIKRAELLDGEDESCEKERAILLNGEKLLGLLDRGYMALYGDSNSLAAIEQVGSALTALSELGRLDPRFLEIAESVRSAAVQLEEAAREMSSYRDGVDLDPGRLDYIQERLDLITRLKRKYAPTVAGILAHAEAAAAELASLDTVDERRGSLEASIASVERELTESCRRLSDLRQRVAESLSAGVTKSLGELNMGKARFAVQLRTTPADAETERGLTVDGHNVKVGPLGIDQCEFLLSANPGEEPKPLGKIASGGEMSRVMLALRTLLSESDDIGTMVFDEIDTGISGRTGQVVAESLARLGLVRQVVCVSHLSQVASMAETHLLVEKASSDSTTTVDVATLDRPGRVKEIARLVGGVELTGTTLKHAEEMLGFAENLRGSWTTRA